MYLKIPRKTDERESTTIHKRYILTQHGYQVIITAIFPLLFYLSIYVKQPYQLLSPPSSYKVINMVSLRF